jgi:SAM-dependent methyltransferase
VPATTILNSGRSFARSAKNLPVRLRFGADFSESVSLEAAGFAGDGRVDYIPSAWISAARSFRRLGLTPEDVVADVGAGKGLVALLAARHPVRRVIGVEIVPELARTAQENVDRSGRLRAGSVEIACSDVLEWPIPPELSVLYMNNPFVGDTFERFIKRVLQSIEEQPRAVRLVYAYPAEHDRLMRIGRPQVLDVQPSGVVGGPGWWKALKVTVTYGLGTGPFAKPRGRRPAKAALDAWARPGVRPRR